MKAVLLSIRPNWCEKIFNGEKTIEVRKNAPKLETPFKVYVYCTAPKERWSVGHQIFFNDTLYTLPTGELKLGDALELRADWLGKYDENNFLNGKVIGSFVCDKHEVFDSAWSEWAYGCAPYDVPCAMPMSEERAIKICKEYGCMSLDDIVKYFGDEDWTAHFWHITEPKLFDKPKMVTEFAVYGRCAQECSEYDICMKYDSKETRVECPDFAKVPLKRAPQSWCYVEEI